MQIYAISPSTTEAHTVRPKTFFFFKIFFFFTFLNFFFYFFFFFFFFEKFFFLKSAMFDFHFLLSISFSSSFSLSF